MLLRKLKEAGNLSGRRVLLRVDFNVPVASGKVTDDFRIKKTLPTIEYLLHNKARVIILSHFESKTEKSLRPVFDYLKERLPIYFAKNFEGLDSAVSYPDISQAVLFENLRLYPGEKNNDPEFAKRLASLGDVYVNEAFSASHREHASIVTLPKLLPSFAGFLLEEEVENLSSAFSPEHPFLFVLGGAKTETKLPLLEKFAKLADKVFVGGVIANDFFKARGWETGRSVVSRQGLNYSQILENLRIVLPDKVLVVDERKRESIKSPNSLSKEDFIKDNILKDSQELKDTINQAKLIVWNGPMGNFEEGFREGTLALAKLILESGARSIIGGGDTLAAIQSLGFEKFGFVSTGGGAMLDFLASGTLPGLEALRLVSSVS
ncbi:MAG: Phosphoglycerate kinase [Parcubacteria group bacterium Gr01-1014_107]|nr:MAG: Phosphoglycerate kinase [Parcubacteria group bacterium Gr01-1014_107]